MQQKPKSWKRVGKNKRCARHGLVFEIMSKTLVANPLWGLKGVPARIILEKNSLTIKSGIIGSKSLPYENISTIEFSGANSLTLSGTIKIIPFRGQSIKADGFTRSQFKIVKQAVDDGCYEDDGGDIMDESCDDNGCDESKRRTVNQKNQSRIEEKPVINLEGEKILNMDVDITNENELVRALNSLVAIVETKGERNDDVEKAGKTKFENYLAILRTSFPDNKLIPYFSSKPTEWKNKEKKETKTIIILLAVAFGLLGLLMLLVRFM
jgi:hypothetical protein